MIQNEGVGFDGVRLGAFVVLSTGPGCFQEGKGNVMFLAVESLLKVDESGRQGWIFLLGAEVEFTKVVNVNEHELTR